MKTHPIYLIAAVDEKMGIGKAGKLPWHLPKDLTFFQKTTTATQDPTKENMVIMGRTTWESIPKDKRPLKGRHNIVLTRQKDYYAPGATPYESLDAAIHSANGLTENIFIIGGGKVYQEAITRPDITGIYLTEIEGDFACDTFFPKIPKKFYQKKLIEKALEKESHFKFYLITT